MVMNSEAPPLKRQFERIFPNNNVGAARGELFFNGNVFSPEHKFLLYWLHFIQQFIHSWYKWFVAWSLMLLFSPPSGTWRTFRTQGEGLFPVACFCMSSAFYLSLVPFIAATEQDPVSLWSLGRARNRLERREGINRPEGGQGRPWSSWTSCEFIHVAIFSQHSHLCLCYFRCFCVWFNMVVQINPVYLYWRIPVIAWITHSKCFFPVSTFCFLNNYLLFLSSQQEIIVPNWNQLKPMGALHSNMFDVLLLLMPCHSCEWQ